MYLLRQYGNLMLQRANAWPNMSYSYYTTPAPAVLSLFENLPVVSLRPPNTRFKARKPPLAIDLTIM